tara:strand:- start:84 stop:1019 length:936 start_codon:yes stop_codon:yes gene_type:complete
MAVRTPLYNNSGNLQEMTSGMIDELIDQVVFQYSTNPSVALEVVGSGGSLGTIADTRLQAGTVSTSSSSFPNEATTQEPQEVTTNFAKINEANASTSIVADTGRTFPVYQSSGDIYAMTLTDFRDTFIHPAINLLVSGSTGTQQGGTYHISTSASVAGSTEVSGSSTAVFIDTRADTSAYSAGTIGDHALDNPTTVTSFFLQRVNGSDTAYSQTPLFIRGDGDLQVYPEATWESLLLEHVRHVATSSTDGFKIVYSLSSGTTRGSGMTNTILNGSGNYQQRQVSSSDYRAQEFPDGVASTATTTFLRINKA